MTITDRAFVTKIFEYKGADRIYTLLTEKYGKMSAIAKSVKKPKSKIAGHLQLLRLVKISLHQSKSKGLNLVTEVEIEKFINDEKLLEHFNLIHYISEITNKTTYENQKSDDYFDFLESYLEFFKKTTFSNLYYYIVFTSQILQIHGFGFGFDRCAACGAKSINQNHYLDSLMHGIVCENCRTSNLKVITSNEIKFIKICQSMNYKLIESINEPENKFLNSLKQILDSSLNYNLDLSLKSSKFI